MPESGIPISISAYLSGDQLAAALCKVLLLSLNIAPCRVLFVTTVLVSSFSQVQPVLILSLWYNVKIFLFLLT